MRGELLSMKWTTFRGSRKVCLVTSDGSRIEAKLLSVGPIWSDDCTDSWNQSLHQQQSCDCLPVQ